MKKLLKHALPPLIGAGYAALAVGLSRLAVHRLSDVFSCIAPLIGLPEDALSYGIQILSQLKSAVILSPWLPCLAIGALVGALLARPVSRRKAMRIVTAVLALLLLLPFALTVLYFTSVNGIRVGALVQTLLPIIPHLL